MDFVICMDLIKAEVQMKTSSNCAPSELLEHFRVGFFKVVR